MNYYSRAIPLAPGTRLGPYEIAAPLGAGGMGEVYRARDTRLDRAVAVKVLPADTAGDPQYRERFEREARAVSALNHPNILSIFDVGREGASDYLITELIDGVMLRDRIGGSGMSARDVIGIGAQIADGLAAAHAAGLVHRDLKPENVMMTRDGRVKILDFGLAKPMGQSAASQHTRTAISDAGMLVGTVGYISPEQVRGLPATPQSDLFALGLVLRELVTGERAFQRASTIESLNAVLKEDLGDLPESVPAGLRHIITHCLEKEPERRFQTASDVAFALRSFASTTTTRPIAADIPHRPRRTIMYAASTLAAAALAAAGFFVARATTVVPVDASALKLEPFAVDAAAETDPEISPDGRSIAYIRNAGTIESEIVVRSDNAPAPAVVLRGHRNARELFWSPDGERIFFFDRDTLWSVATIGGEAREEIAGVLGGHMARDGKTFAVVKTPATAGGSSAQLFVGSRDHLVPYDPQPSSVQTQCTPSIVRFSPDSTKILLWRTCAEKAIVIVPSPDANGKGGAARQLFASRADTLIGGADWLSDSRHIVISNEGALWLGDTETGEATRLTNGTTALLAPKVGPGDRVVTTEAIVDHDIVELPISGGSPRLLVNSSRYDGSPAWAPTGDTLAYVVDAAQGPEIWTRTVNGVSARRLLAATDFPDARPEGIRALAYSADGQWLAFTVFVGGPVFRSGVWVIPASGGAPRLVSPKDTVALLPSWSPDGRSLAMDVIGKVEIELSIVGVGTSSSRRLDLPAGSDIRGAEWSPTGEWIATRDIKADSSGGTLLIRPSDGAARRLPGLSSTALAWSKDGKTLYGIATTDTSSEVRALDIASGTIRTIATYSTRLRVEDTIGGTVRLWLDPAGRSFVTTILTDRSNVWLLKGLQDVIGRK